MTGTTLAAAAAILVCAPAFPAAAGAAVEGIQVSLPGDADMSCAQIEHEVGAMDEIVAESRKTIDKADEASIGVGVVKTLGSFLVGTLTGTIGFMAAGHLAAEAASEHADGAQAVEDTALQRRSLMVGIFQAKKCDGSLPESPAPREKLWPPRLTPAAASVEPAAGDTGGESGVSAGDAALRAPLPHELRAYNN